jgi:hypothetical protein
MLQERNPDHFRCLTRPLACVTATVLFLSTAAARADTSAVDDGDAPLATTPASADHESLALAPATFDFGWLTTLAHGSSAALVGGARPAALAGTAPPSPPLEGAAALEARAVATAAPTAVPAGLTVPSSDDGSSLRMAGYLAGGVGIAALVLFAVAGIGAKSAHDRLDENCRDRPCDPTTRDSDIQDGKMLQTAANIGLATGLAGLGLGATLIVLGGRSSSDVPPAAGTTATGGMVTYGARF